MLLAEYLLLFPVLLLIPLHQQVLLPLPLVFETLPVELLPLVEQHQFHLTGCGGRGGGAARISCWCRCRRWS